MSTNKFQNFRFQNLTEKFANMIIKKNNDCKILENCNQVTNCLETMYFSNLKQKIGLLKTVDAAYDSDGSNNIAKY